MSSHVFHENYLDFNWHQVGSVVNRLERDQDYQEDQDTEKPG